MFAPIAARSHRATFDGLAWDPNDPKSPEFLDAITDMAEEERS